ncbi:cytochrome P450 71AU50-like [Salvia splendens]|uniref:cytochrome P450 71AU50-like n=1 Tax=Salvia splendens TaxID=180675 RepID=UPI001C260C97|nr:cytochrome P450 71AU50-like [Salvia splendens]
MELTWFWLTVVAVLAGSLASLAMRRKKKLPPGPKGIPILGNLHMLGENPHHDLQRIAKDHGPIMYMRFGFAPIIVVSSPEAAELFLKTHDLVFASRPPQQGFRYLSWGQRNLAFGAYGSYWQNMSKLCTVELLSTLKISSFRSMRREELGLFVESLNEASRLHVAVDLSAKVVSLTAEMSCRMMFGKKYNDKDIDERGFKGVVQEVMTLVAAPNLGDYFPFLGVLDLQGLTRKLKAIAKVFDVFFEKIIEDHVRSGGRPEQAKDIVDTMMSIMQSGESEFQFDRRNIKAIMLDLLIASMDTAAASIEWILSELLRNPTVMKKLQKELEQVVSTVMKKLQKELEQVVGLKRIVEESDLDQLEYLDMVVKESFRLHPAAPLLLPHYSREDSKVNGYDIPKDSRIIINTYAIGRDPNVWTDPEKFIPERFIGSDIDVRGQHFQLLPFGSGRRGCAGMKLGLIQVRLIVSQLVHCFDWQLPNEMSPEELDMNEEFGIVVSRVNHLMAIPTFRLHN